MGSALRAGGLCGALQAAGSGTAWRSIMPARGRTGSSLRCVLHHHLQWLRTNKLYECGLPCRLLEGVSGVDHIDRFDCAEFPTRFAAQIKNFDDEG